MLQHSLTSAQSLFPANAVQCNATQLQRWLTQPHAHTNGCMWMRALWFANALVARNSALHSIFHLNSLVRLHSGQRYPTEGFAPLNTKYDLLLGPLMSFRNFHPWHYFLASAGVTRDRFTFDSTAAGALERWAAGILTIRHHSTPKIFTKSKQLPSSSQHGSATTITPKHTHAPSLLCCAFALLTLCHFCRRSCFVWPVENVANVAQAHTTNLLFRDPLPAKSLTWLASEKPILHIATSASKPQFFWVHFSA